MNASLPQAPSSGETMLVSEAWIACGGNPEHPAGRGHTLEAIRLNAEIADEAADRDVISRMAALLETSDADSRDRFEKAIYHQYFLSTIQKTPQGPFALMNIGTVTKAEFLARKDDGDYVEDSINGAWWAWKSAEVRLLQRLAVVHRFVPLPITYAPSGIVLPHGMPFDGKPVLLQTREGVIEAGWIPEERKTTSEGTEVEGFCFYAERGSVDIQIDEIQGWMPIPQVIPDPPLEESSEPQETPR